MVLNYTVRFSDEGWKKYQKLDKQVRLKVTRKIELLADFKTLNNVKKMKSKSGDFYRLRVGDIRVIFRIPEGTKIIWVVDVGFRGLIYR